MSSSPKELEHDLDSTNLSIIILMAKKIEELKEGINADDKELFTTLAAQIRELADDNFELRKQLKIEKKQKEELLKDRDNMQKTIDKQKKWKKGLNDYRKKYEMLRYGYIHNCGTKMIEKEAENGKQQSGSIDANQEGT